MKKICSLILSLLLCIAMVTPGLAAGYAENVLNLPESLLAIEEEAFEGTTSVKKVVVPEGTTHIGPRAFADSKAREIYLPVSVESISDGAFDGCDDLTVYVYRNSYAHEYMHDSGVRYSIIESAAADMVYAIHSVTYAETLNSFQVTVDTTDACDVQVSLLDENNGSALLVFNGSAEANLRSSIASATMDGEFTLPRFYVLEAKLIGEDGEILCTYTTQKYTSRHAEIENKTPADYTGEVVTFGDAGYGVLEQGVKQLSGIQSGSGYIVPSAGISKGDVLLVKVGDVHKAVKVKSFTDNGNGTVTVQPDDTIQMGEVYQRLSIDSYMQPVGGIAPAYTDESDIKIIPVNVSFGTGPLTMSGELEFRIKMKFTFDKKEDYFFAECWIAHSGTVKVSITGEFDTRDLDKRLAPVFYKAGVEIPKLDTEAQMVISLPLDLDFSAGGSASMRYESKTGFTYNSDDKIFEKIEEDSSEAYAEVEGDLTITAGPEISFSAELMDWLDAKIWGQVGLEAVGKLEGLKYGGSVSAPNAPDELHACDGCVDLDINLIAGIWGSLECTALKALKVKLMDNELFVVRGKIADGFYSFLNDVESPYGGEPTFGFGFVAKEEGTCRNIKYRADISTIDYKNAAVRDIPVTSTGVYGTVLNSNSPCTMYLYPGSNAFTAQFANSTVSTTETMYKKAKAITIKEEPVTITVHVTDEQSGAAIADAHVATTLPDGSVRNGETNALGVFTFDTLPQGNYSFVVSKDGYDSEEVSNKTYLAGSNNTLSVSLSRNELPVLTAYTSSAGTVQALTSDGTLPQGLPKVTITTTEDSSGFIKNVTVNHENCATALTTSGTYIGYVDFFAVDMGDGEYTYVLSLGNAGTGGGCTITVFREVNGTLVTSSLPLSKITATGTFTDNTHFNATISPSNVSVSGTMPLPYDGFKRKGSTLSPMGSGYLNYEKNDDGAYDLIYELRIASGGYNWDNIATCNTRFMLDGNNVVIDSQWFEMYEGGTLD